MRSALGLVCRQGSRGYSYKVTRFPAMPCPPDFSIPYRCKVANDESPQPEQVICRDMRGIKLDPCETSGMQGIKSDPCATSERPKPPKEPREPFRSMWEASNAISEQRNCKDLVTRFDTLYYHPRYDRRAFQRTWTECPPVKQRLRKVCCLDGIEPPEVQYRHRERCPDICGMDYKQLLALCCDEEWAQDPARKCLKHYWPCCPRARCKPCCKIPRRKTICERLRAPYPSFSESVRGLNLAPIVECRCLEAVPRCVALQEELHRKFLDQPPSC